MYLKSTSCGVRHLSSLNIRCIRSASIACFQLASPFCHLGDQLHLNSTILNIQNYNLQFFIFAELCITKVQRALSVLRQTTWSNISRGSSNQQTATLFCRQNGFSGKRRVHQTSISKLTYYTRPSALQTTYMWPMEWVGFRVPTEVMNEWRLRLRLKDYRSFPNKRPGAFTCSRKVNPGMWN